ncbi:hypothetical protein IGI04_005716 [Brassica rapa subsp. trilocularis]|uniref:Uncharacterized protein n=2 Tax=Brassica campestris TaxID=3711 RepID=A0A8D9M0B7_BRACM|nr:hypothetical protein IGI04_005716 [Brassica rapa subsp. trilocularis]CAG7892705.1 unnamed protein product [Brassica rapa]
MDAKLSPAQDCPQLSELQSCSGESEVDEAQDYPVGSMKLLLVCEFHIRPTTDDRYLILRGSGDCFVIIYRYTNIGISETEPC